MKWTKIIPSNKTTHPPLDTCVLVLTKKEFGGYIAIRTCFSLDGISHWMPLPELPKEEK